MNHDFLRRTVNIAGARNFYDSIEQLQSWNSHFWLQRGSLEVELDELPSAENFLNQARGLAPDDPLVDNETAYLLFRKAIVSPGSGTAASLADEATGMLEDLIQRRGDLDPYPYHVLGSQGLSWSRRGIPNRDRKADYLRRLLVQIKAGREKHPRNAELAQLSKDVSNELLAIATT